MTTERQRPVQQTKRESDKVQQGIRRRNRNKERRG